MRLVIDELLPDLHDGEDVEGAFNIFCKWTSWPDHFVNLVDDPDFRDRNPDIDFTRWASWMPGEGLDERYGLFCQLGMFGPPDGCNDLFRVDGVIDLKSIVPVVLGRLFVDHDILPAGLSGDS